MTTFGGNIFFPNINWTLRFCIFPRNGKNGSSYFAETLRSKYADQPVAFEQAFNAPVVGDRCELKTASSLI